MRILQLIRDHNGGGAERIAAMLHDGFRAAGHDALLLDRTDLPMSHGRGTLRRIASRIDRRLERPAAALRRRRGYDDFDFPWTRLLPHGLPGVGRVDVLQLHNLHGGWFDLRELPRISRAVPTFVTLHDASLLLPGPHHAVEMTDRPRHWSPRVLEANHRARQAALAGAALHLISPALWLLHEATAALVWVTRTSSHIPHGVDAAVFQPPREPPAGAPRLLVAGHASTTGFRDVSLIDAVVPEVLRRSPGVRATVFGHLDAPVCAAHARVDVRGPVPQPEVAALMRSHHALLYATRADTHPGTVREAQACGCLPIASDLPALREMITAPAEGRLFDGAEAATAACCEVLRAPRSGGVAAPPFKETVRAYLSTYGGTGRRV